MAEVNFKPSQRFAVVGAINPQSATTVQSTGWIDATKFHNFLAVIKSGVITATGTLDAKLQQASDGSGTGVKDVTGKAIAQMVATTNNNQQAVINLKQEDLDFANGFSFFRLSVTPATAAALIDGTVYGLDPRYGVASDNAAASQAQTI